MSTLGPSSGLRAKAGRIVRDDPEARQDGDVDLGVAEEPEEVLPEERRSARVRLQLVAEDQTRRDEEAGARHAVEDEQDAGGQQHREGDRGR